MEIKIEVSKSFTNQVFQEVQKAHEQERIELARRNGLPDNTSWETLIELGQLVHKDNITTMNTIDDQLGTDLAGSYSYMHGQLGDILYYPSFSHSNELNRALHRYLFELQKVDAQLSVTMGPEDPASLLLTNTLLYAISDYTRDPNTFDEEGYPTNIDELRQWHKEEC